MGKYLYGILTITIYDHKFDLRFPMAYAKCVGTRIKDGHLIMNMIGGLTPHAKFVLWLSRFVAIQYNEDSE